MIWVSHVVDKVRNQRPSGLRCRQWWNWRSHYPGTSWNISAYKYCTLPPCSPRTYIALPGKKQLHYLSDESKKILKSISNQFYK